MRRVVVTGLGIASCLGNNKSDVTASLISGRSGISFIAEYERLGFRSRIAGVPPIDLDTALDRKQKRFMGDAAAYSFLAMRDAIADAGLTPTEVSDPKVGVLAGSGGGSVANTIETADDLRNKGIRRVGPYRVARTMCSTVSANLATQFQIRGVNYSISSACATSAHCIGSAMQLIQYGLQDRIFAGGGEEVHWGMTAMFDAMGALSSGSNSRPQEASRPFDSHRDGFVIAGGGGILVLEALELAQKRGAHIYAEVVGYGATSDGQDMVAPSGEGAERCMRLALGTSGVPVDYLNAHGTSTLAGDAMELKAIRNVFASDVPMISSTKSLSGHALGAAGVHEAIYSLLMLEGGFIAPSINIETACPEAEGLPIICQSREIRINRFMSNSFGFGGTNATLIFQRYPL
ncbi:MAG: beta-ketoacyl-ACP synthase I [Gammaproteobacteria bacterium]